MTIERKLNPTQELEVALAYLCGVGCGDIKEIYGVSKSTIRISTLKRSNGWGDPLVELYKETDFHNRELNAVHMYLSFQKGVDLPEPSNLIKSNESYQPNNDVNYKPVYNMVKRMIFDPKIESVIERTTFDQYAKSTNPYDDLIQGVCGDNASPKNMVNNILVDILNKNYAPEGSIESMIKGKLILKNVFDSVENTIFNKVKDGALAWSDYKKGIVDDVLKTLTPREYKITGERFGLCGYDGPNTFEEAGILNSVSRERVRKILTKSLRKLKTPTNLKILSVFTTLKTDNEIKDYLTKFVEKKNVKSQKRGLSTNVLVDYAKNNSHLNNEELLENNKFNITVDEMNLSLRTHNCLKHGLGAKTLKDIVSKSEYELMILRNFGNKSLKELKVFLDGVGLKLKKR